MANRLEYVRSRLKTRKTGKGTELEIKVHYVPGEKPLVMVNGNPCGPDWLAASRFVIHLMEEFRLHVDREFKREASSLERTAENV